MTKSRDTAKPKHLPQYVGYREVEDALGVARRTVERMVREGKFPRPTQLAPNRVGWQVDVVTAWLAEREAGLVAHAVAHPEDLKPEQLDAIAFDRLRQIVSEQAGHDVDMKDVRIQYRPPTADEEGALPSELTLAALESMFGHFDEARCAVLAAWIFPGMRHIFAWNDDPASRLLKNDEDHLRATAVRALDDDLWAEYREEVRQLNAQGSTGRPPNQPPTKRRQ